MQFLCGLRPNNAVIFFASLAHVSLPACLQSLAPFSCGSLRSQLTLQFLKPNPKLSNSHPAVRSSTFILGHWAHYRCTVASQVSPCSWLLPMHLVGFSSRKASKFYQGSNRNLNGQHQVRRKVILEQHLLCPAHSTVQPSYLLGLLAMIKCSICSYQCDN